MGLSHKLRLLVQESSIHPVGIHYAQNERMAGMVAAAAKVAESRSHDADRTLVFLRRIVVYPEHHSS